MKRYAYETHLHTNQGSRCGQFTGAQMAQLYHAAGYSGIVITDHFIGGNTAIDLDLPWEQWVDGFCAGYESAKAEGNKLGLQVFFGWESGFNGTEFLIYGLDKEWLLAHPQIRSCTIEQQYELVRNGGGIVVHAHPFRVRSYIKEIRLFPQYVDAVEAVNASHSSIASRQDPQDLLANEQALSYAKQNGLPLTAGSDQHGSDLFYGGMIFGRKLKDVHDLVRAIRNADYLELLDGTKPIL